MEQSCNDSNISISTLQMGLLRRYNELGNTQKEGDATLPDYLQYFPRSQSQEKRPNMASIAALDFNPLFGAFHPYSPIALTHELLPECKSRLLHPLVLGAGNYCQRRLRGEKKSIPDNQKDERYFERRKRNNQAAKKSRDARKIREDQIALRAAILEHENAMMRAQIITLREETQALRGMLLLTKKTTPTTRSPLAPAQTPYFKQSLLPPIISNDTQE